MRDLQRLQEKHPAVQGKLSLVRCHAQGVLAQVLRCVEAQLSPTIRPERSAPAPVAATSENAV